MKLDIIIKKWYRKISIIAYTNVLLIILLKIFHDIIMNVTHTILFGIIIFYALINGIYIQKELYKQKKYEVGMINEKNLSENILKIIPTGIVIINSNNTIKYRNKAFLNITGTKSSLELNGNEQRGTLLENMDNEFKNAINGQKILNKKYNYYCEIKEKDVFIEYSIVPFRFQEEENNYDIMVYINDITESIVLNNKIEEQYLSMFKSFVKFIDAKDEYTGKHSSSVTEYVGKMLTVINNKNINKQDIITAAALHDIGKIGVPESILNKTDKLEYEEYEKMKEHSTIGANLIGEINDYENISLIINHHHEKWDGTGYPDGLSNYNIPIGSRIIAIADAFDAITTDRVYRKKRDTDEGISILLSEKGKQFDPVLVDDFIKIINESK